MKASHFNSKQNVFRLLFSLTKPLYVDQIESDAKLSVAYLQFMVFAKFVQCASVTTK